MEDGKTKIGTLERGLRRKPSEHNECHPGMTVEASEYSVHVDQTTMSAHAVDLKVYETIEQMDPEKVKDLMLTLVLKRNVALNRAIIDEHAVWSVEQRQLEVKSLEILNHLQNTFPNADRLICKLIAMFVLGDPNSSWTEEEQKKIFNAAKHGRLEELKTYLEAGGPIDCTPFGSQSPLYIASFYGRLNCVNYLASHGADLDKTEKQDYTAAHAAASQGQLEILQALRKHGADVSKLTNTGQSCLTLCSGAPNIKAWLQTLPEIQQSAHFNMSDAGNHVQKKLLFDSAKRGDLEQVRTCVENGCPLDCTPYGSQTPCYIAAYYGQRDCLDYLLQQGANFNHTEKDGFTPAHAAASRGKLESLQTLVNHGASLTYATPNGQTCLTLSERASCRVFLDSDFFKQRRQ